MNTGLLADFIMDVKNWIYNWDTITFSLVVIIVSLLMVASVTSFLKAIIKEKVKFKLLPIIYLALLTAMLVIILISRK